MTHHHHSEQPLVRDGAPSDVRLESTPARDEGAPARRDEGSSASAHRTGEGAPDEGFTLSQAASATGVHRSTLRRALEAGKFPGAVRHADGDQGDQFVWRIPVDDLLAAGYSVRVDEGTSSRFADVIDLRDDTTPADEPTRALQTLEGWRSSLHQLANELAAATEAKGRAEIKLEWERERLAQRTAERDKARADAEELTRQIAASRRRRWFRR